MAKNHNTDPLVTEGMSHFADNMAAHKSEQADLALVDQLESDAAWQPGLPEKQYRNGTDWKNYEYLPYAPTGTMDDADAEQRDGTEADWKKFAGQEAATPERQSAMQDLGRAAAKDRHPSSQEIDLTESEDADDNDKTLVGV